MRIFEHSYQVITAVTPDTDLLSILDKIKATDHARVNWYIINYRQNGSIADLVYDILGIDETLSIEGLTCIPFDLASKQEFPEYAQINAALSFIDTSHEGKTWITNFNIEISTAKLARKRVPLEDSGKDKFIDLLKNHVSFLEGS